MDIQFSNSLTIHEAKTKENHKHDGFGKLYQTLTLVFGHVSKPRTFVKKLGCASVVGVWKHDETLVRVFDTLLHAMYICPNVLG